MGTARMDYDVPTLDRDDRVDPDAMARHVEAVRRRLVGIVSEAGEAGSLQGSDGVAGRLALSDERWAGLHAALDAELASCLSNLLEPMRRRLSETEAERDEADRRAGAAERLRAFDQDSIQCRQRWLRDAKAARGYPSSISFDVVWADTCALADRAIAAGLAGEAPTGPGDGARGRGPGRRPA